MLLLHGDKRELHMLLLMLLLLSWCCLLLLLQVLDAFTPHGAAGGVLCGVFAAC